MDLLERDDALARLDSAVASAAGGGGRFVAVSGEAGIGKTSLVRRFAESLGDDVRVLWGACDDLTVPQPLAPLEDIAEQVGGPLLDRLDDADVRGLARAIRDELATDRGGATVCVLEDCHWADEATLDALAFVARRIGRLPAVLLVTFRDDEVGTDHPLRAVVGSIPPEDVVRVALPPLTRNAIAGLTGEPDTVLALTGGNPFLVTELIGSSGESGVPETVRDAVLARAARLGAAATGVLELISVIPARAELALIQGHAGTDARAAVETCERRGLLVVEGDAVRFRHELARRAYRDSLPASRRIDLNRAVLAMLESDGAEPARLVHHAEAGEDRDALARHAVTAARRAAAARSHREAFALFERALQAEEALDPATRAEVHEGLSEEAYALSRPDVGVPARERAVALRRELGDTLGTGAGLRRLSRLHWWAGSRADADRTAAEAIAVLEPLGPTRELAMAYSNQSQLQMLAQENDAAIASGERAMDLAREFGDLDTLLHAQINVGGARMFDDADTGREQVVDAGRRAADAGLDEHACRAFHNVASVDFDQRRLELAATEIDYAIEVAQRFDHLWFEVDTVVLRALLDLDAGRWQQAIATLDDLLGSIELPGVSMVPVLRVMASVEVRQGGAQAQALVAEAWETAALVDELQWTRPAAALRAEAAWLAGEAGAVDEATGTVLATAEEQGHGWDIGGLAIWRHRAGLSTPSPDRCAPPYAHSLAGDWRAAADAWREIGAPYELALALCDAAEPEPLLEGLELLDGLGAAAPARVVRRRLQELGVRSVPRGPRPSTRANAAGLSTRQMEVLRLVADGLSNPEIARQLFLTPKTVEHHVTAILRKLEAGSRAEAVERARAAGVLAS